MYNIIEYFLRLIVNDVSLEHTFGWSLTGTATLMETLIGLSRVMSTIRRVLSDFLVSTNTSTFLFNRYIIIIHNIIILFILY